MRVCRDAVFDSSAMQILVATTKQKLAGLHVRFVDAARVDTPGDFAMQVALPVDEGEGMVLYGWQDKDGDEAFCRPGVDDELSGVTVVSVWAVRTWQGFARKLMRLRFKRGCYGRLGH